MPSTRVSTTLRTRQDSPELLIAYLQYAVAEVSALSERSGRYLQRAIDTLSEDTSLIDVGDVVGRQPS
jgi:hypothetical protein